jgi:hypothetical protein
MKNTLIFIALCAVFIRATGQNRLENTSAEASQACIPAHQFAELTSSIAGTQTDTYGKTTVALGAYERVSPDGRFVLRSFSGARLGEVSLIELSAQGQVIRAIPTPLKNEAFPVQGSWRYLVDTNGDHYTFESIVRVFPERNPNERRTISELANRKIMQNALTNAPQRPVFRGGMDGFYAAASELPSSKPDHIRISPGPMLRAIRRRRAKARSSRARSRWTRAVMPSPPILAPSSIAASAFAKTARFMRCR